MTEKYFDFWASRILERFKKNDSLKLCDVGAGTGALATSLIRCSSSISVDCVEPIVVPPEPCGEGIRYIKKDACEFFRSCLPRFYDGIIFKQSFHHVDPIHWPNVLADIGKTLSPSGKLLILTMPERIEYPSFELVRKKFSENQLSHQKLKLSLEQAGFDVIINPVDYPVRLSKEEFLSAYRSRFISDLRELSDFEIESGLAEMVETFSISNVVEFSDRLWIFEAACCGKTCQTS